MTPEENDQHFLRALRNSEDSKWRVAVWLNKKGYPVVLPPFRERPTYEDRKRYADNGDLSVSMRVEIKHRRTDNFTCREDFPFPDFMVCKVRTFEEAWPKVYAWVHLNPPMTHAAIIFAANQPRWFVRSVTATNRPCGDQDHYFARLDDVIFQKLDLWEENTR